MVGNFPGALAQINVLLSVFFAGISGSSTADAASQGKIFIEAQVKEGYDLSFSIAITAVSAVLAVIIPPSILMIVWGGVLSVSIGALYLAGVIPGLLIGLAQMATVHGYAKLRNYPVYPRATFKEFFASAAVSVPALFTPSSSSAASCWAGSRPRNRRAWQCCTPRCCRWCSIARWTQAAVARAARDGQAGRGRAVLRRHGVGVRWLLAFFQIPKALLENVTSWGMGLTASDSSSRSCSWWWAASSTPSLPSSSWEPPPAARRVGRHASGVVRHHRHRGARVRAGHAAYGLCLMISCAIAKVRLRYALKDTLIMLVPMLLVLAMLIVWPEIALILPRWIRPDFLK
jgi:TRAP-type uncharacterized transport system fused permease subunit